MIVLTYKPITTDALLANVEIMTVEQVDTYYQTQDVAKKNAPLYESLSGNVMPFYVFTEEHGTVDKCRAHVVTDYKKHVPSVIAKWGADAKYYWTIRREQVSRKIKACLQNVLTCIVRTKGFVSDISSIPVVSGCQQNVYTQMVYHAVGSVDEEGHYCNVFDTTTLSVLDYMDVDEMKGKIKSDYFIKHCEGETLIAPIASIPVPNAEPVPEAKVEAKVPEAKAESKLPHSVRRTLDWILPTTIVQRPIDSSNGTPDEYHSSLSFRSIMKQRMADTPGWAYVPTDMKKVPTMKLHHETKKRIISAGRGRKGKEMPLCVDNREGFDRKPCNMAIHTGFTSGFTVLDIDFKDDGLAVWSKIARQHALSYYPDDPSGIRGMQIVNMGDWYVVYSGSGGCHIYFDYEPDLISNSKIVKFDGKTIGIDLKNDNGLITSAHSMHKNGNIYEENYELEPYLEQRGGKFPKMPDWIKRMCSGDATIEEVCMGPDDSKDIRYEIRLPSDYRRGPDVKWDNINSRSLLQLVEFLPSDVAFSFTGWQRGMRCLSRIANDFKVPMIRDVAIAFAKKAISVEGQNAYNEEKALSCFGGKTKSTDYDLGYLVTIARNYQTKINKGVEFAEFEATLRALVPDAVFSMLAPACGSPNSTVEGLEDLYLQTIYKVGTTTDSEWVIRTENGLSKPSKTAPFTKTIDNYILMGDDIPKGADGKRMTASGILRLLQTKPRFTPNIFTGINCVPSFHKPILCSTDGKKRVLNTFTRFDTMAEDIPEEKRGVAIPVYEDTARGVYDRIRSERKECKRESKEEVKLTNLVDHLRARGKLQVFLDHMYTELCWKNKWTYSYFVYWMAHMIQQPSSKIAQWLVFIGIQGTGKNLFWDFVAKYIIGDNYAITCNDVDQLTGKFNAWQVSKLLTTLNECGTFAGDHKSADKLKSIGSDKKQLAEPKGVDAHQVDSFGRFIILTNNDSPVRVEKTDRRYCVCEGPQRKEDLMPEEYYKYIGDIVEDAKCSQLKTVAGRELAAEFVNYFMSIDLAGWSMRDIPNTPARVAMCVRSLDGYIRFMYRIAHGELLEFKLGSREKVMLYDIKAETLYARACEWLGRPIADCKIADFKKMIKKDLGLEPEDIKSKGVKVRAYRIILPVLQDKFRTLLDDSEHKFGPDEAKEALEDEGFDLD